MRRNKLGQFIKGFQYPKEWALKRVRPKGLKYKIKIKNKAWFKRRGVSWNKNKKGLYGPNSGSFKKGEHGSPATELKKGDEKLMGENNPRWKGGITPLNVKIRSSYKAREWRMRVFSRDNFICQSCYQKGGRLTAHHINSWSEFPQLRFDIDNGITLCERCHKLSSSYKKYENFS